MREYENFLEIGIFIETGVSELCDDIQCDVERHFNIRCRQSIDTIRGQGDILWLTVGINEGYSEIIEAIAEKYPCPLIVAKSVTNTGYEICYARGDLLETKEYELDMKIPENFLVRSGTMHI